MCDYCDCRRLAPISALSDDHAALGALAARVRTAIACGDGDAGARAFAAFVPLLRAHTEAEERGLFSELRAEGSMLEHIETLEDDHRELRAALDALDEFDAGAATTLLDRLAAHIWVEEYDIFPASVVGLSSDGWNRVIERTAGATAPKGHDHGIAA